MGRLFSGFFLPHLSRIDKTTEGLHRGVARTGIGLRATRSDAARGGPSLAALVHAKGVVFDSDFVF